MQTGGREAAAADARRSANDKNQEWPLEGSWTTVSVTAPPNCAFRPFRSPVPGDSDHRFRSFRSLIGAERRSSFLGPVHFIPGGILAWSAFLGHGGCRFLRNRLHRKPPVRRSRVGTMHSTPSFHAFGFFSAGFSRARSGFFALVFACTSLIDGPSSVILWARWTSRSQIASASVASPIRPCHAVTGS